METALDISDRPKRWIKTRRHQDILAVTTVLALGMGMIRGRGGYSRGLPVSWEGMIRAFGESEPGQIDGGLTKAVGALRTGGPGSEL